MVPASAIDTELVKKDSVALLVLSLKRACLLLFSLRAVVVRLISRTFWQLHKFNLFETAVQEISELAMELPQDGCINLNDTNSTTPNNVTFSGEDEASGSHEILDKVGVPIEGSHKGECETMETNNAGCSGYSAKVFEF